ncbi:MAG: oligosaccharide flippase family protein [Bacteroidales bacterium]|nr:oligosaccharide flippase family protein [Bacteroidales bacterium]
MSDNPFKKLAGQTVVYGLGTILARLLNYLLVPLYVRVFAPEIYGQFTELYAYIALFMALLTYGMETTFFRRAQGDNFSKVYGNIMTSILTTTGVFVAAVICLYPFVADLINYDGREIYLLFTGLIVAVDAITAVPFCVLRKNEKPGRFSLIKLSNVCINVAVVLFCLFVIPDTCTRLSNQWFGPEAGLLTWVFISNLVASLCNVLMLLPEFKQIKLQFDWTLMKKLLGYALPVMLINLIGMVNEVVDKIVIKYMVADKATAMTQLGIYGANYKLAVLMTIFVQMFRFASEPFFFNKAKDRNSPQLFADVMKYFVICGLLIFLGVTLYLDLFGYFLGGHDTMGMQYREGLAIVPVVLIANLFYGITFNLSIWFKLNKQTTYGTIITAIGAAVTLVCLFGLVPVIGYWGAAIAHLACYTVMMTVSYLWGQNYLRKLQRQGQPKTDDMQLVTPIPYATGRILMYLAVALGIYALSVLARPASNVLMYTLNTCYLLAFAGFAFLMERKRR